MLAARRARPPSVPAVAGGVGRPFLPVDIAHFIWPLADADSVNISEVPAAIFAFI
jgi:hypothetical protein